MHPDDADPVLVVRRAFDEQGLRVLKLHCSVGAFAADHPRLHGVWDLVGRLRMPVVVHAGHASSGQTTPDELKPIETVARRFPDATIIIAHCGYPSTEAALDLVERHAEIYADLTPVVVQRAAVSARLESAHEKILFGSDAPNVALRAGDYLRELRTAITNQGVLDAILGGNARRLIERTQP